MKLSVKKHSATQRALVFGPPKSGKTQLVGELATAFDLLWFDLENGFATLFKLPQEQQERIELISIPDTRGWPVAIETCLKVIRGGSHKICEEHGKVGCALCTRNSGAFTEVNLNETPQSTIVVFDSITQLTNSAIAHITRAQPDDYKMQTDDWGNLGKLLDIFFSHIQQAPFNVVCISHETDTDTENAAKNKVVPVAGTRNFSRNVAKYFDHVIYCERKNKKHIAASSTSYSTQIMTGSRTDVAVESLESPSILSIFTGETPQQATKPDARSILNSLKSK